MGNRLEQSRYAPISDTFNLNTFRWISSKLINSEMRLISTETVRLCGQWARRCARRMLNIVVHSYFRLTGSIAWRAMHSAFEHYCRCVSVVQPTTLDQRRKCIRKCWHVESEWLPLCATKYKWNYTIRQWFACVGWISAMRGTSNERT